MIPRRSALLSLAALAAAGALTLTLRPGQAAPHATRALTPEDIAAEGALVVDIRAPSEWAETGVIQGARLLTFTDAASFLAAIGPDLAPGQPLLLVCHSGRRSAAAAEALSGILQNPVISQDGGMSAWIATGQPVVAAP